MNNWKLMFKIIPWLGGAVAGFLAALAIGVTMEHRGLFPERVLDEWGISAGISVVDQKMYAYDEDNLLSGKTDFSEKMNLKELLISPADAEYKCLVTLNRDGDAVRLMSIFAKDLSLVASLDRHEDGTRVFSYTIEKDGEKTTFQDYEPLGQWDLKTTGHDVSIWVDNEWEKVISVGDDIAETLRGQYKFEDDGWAKTEQ